MERLMEVMTEMLQNPYYRKQEEPREVLCKVCRAILADDYYTAVHVLNDTLNFLRPEGLYVPEWRMRQFEEFSNLSQAVSGVFVARMELIIEESL